MKYFIDTEFIEKPNTIDLISIGIVGEDGSVYYAISRDFPLKEVYQNEWLRTNVLKPIYDEFNTINAKFSKNQIQFCIDSIGKPIGLIRKEILGFIDKKPEFYGYYADYDWVIFCWIFGRMLDLPEHFPMYCRDLKQMMDECELDKKWKQDNCPDSENEHNALADARWNLELYNAIIKHKEQ